MSFDPSEYFGDDQFIPSGGGDFVRTGFIAPFKSKMMFKINVDAIDLDTGDYDEELKEKGVSPRGWAEKRKLPTSNWYYYYYNVDKYQDVSTVAKVLNTFSPTQVWVFGADTDKVINVQDKEGLRAGWGNTIFLEANVRTWQSKKYRHEFQLIALPAAVHAYARMRGWNVPKFDLSVLLNDNTLFTDELQERLIGHPDAKYKTPEFEKCELFQARKALWSALGEDDPYVYTTKDYVDSQGKPGKWNTRSDMLSECLYLVGKQWKQPIWCNVVQVNDPRVDAVTKSDNRLTIPVILEMYENEKAAISAAGSLLDEQEAATASRKAPPLPAQWKNLEKQWRELIVSEYINLSVPEIWDKVDSSIGASIDDVLDWVKYLKSAQ